MRYDSKRILIFGGAGSLGRTLVSRFTKQNAQIHVFSRDEAKHHSLTQDFPKVETHIGDIRDSDSVYTIINRVDPHVVINCAALKQVPACEYAPCEAVMTNVIGSYNLVRAVENSRNFGINKKILSISTDKAAKPINSYGMTKALQERIHLNGINACFNCVRYGNVLESTGSVIPVFKKLAKQGRPLMVTHKEMTRFFLSLEEAVDLIFKTLKEPVGGYIFVPKVKSAKIMDLAKIMSKDFPPSVGQIRPGEKLDEILISEEELRRTEDRGDVFVIHDIKSDKNFDHVTREYSSANCLMTEEEFKKFLEKHGVI